MLRRTALVLLGLLVTAAAGIFAADRLGVDLPWTIASTETPEQSSADGEPTRAADEAPGKASASAERAIEDTVAALTGESTAETVSSPGDVALDISRISPDGPSVFAGRADPGAYITVYADGKSAGTVQADDGGSWSLSTEHKFASADPNITFESAPTPPAKSSEPAASAETAAAEETTTTAAAEAPPATEQVTEDAPAAAGDVMRKFEELVSEAREDAAREKAAEDEAARQKEEERRQQAQAQTQAALKAQRDAEQATAEAARKEAEKVAAETARNETERKEAERETVVAAATETPAPSTTSAASDKPQAEAAREKPAASSDTTASASADAVPGTKSTVDGDTARKDTETKAAVLAAPGKTAKPEAQAPIPVPIMFVYNQATLTPEGERAAELLLEYLLLKRLDAVELTGHADERGTHNYNFDLSRERLEAVSRILTNGGYKGKLKLTPKGKTEPFKGIDRKKYRGEALYQFDRRVELRVTR